MHNSKIPVPYSSMLDIAPTNLLLQAAKLEHFP